jgi:hypothetical protein
MEHGVKFYTSQTSFEAGDFYFCYVNRVEIYTNNSLNKPQLLQTSKYFCNTTAHDDAVL